MTEAVAPGRARVLADVLLRQRQLAGQLDAEVVLVLLLDLRLGGCLDRAVPVAVQLRLDLRRRDQLGQHPGERVDLVPAELGARGEAAGAPAGQASQPPRGRISVLSAARAVLAPGARLAGAVVAARAAARGPWRW